MSLTRTVGSPTPYGAQAVPPSVVAEMPTWGAGRMVFRAAARGSKNTRVMGRSGRPFCFAANVAVAQLSPGLAMDALTTRTAPVACATEVIQRFWLSCQVTLVT